MSFGHILTGLFEARVVRPQVSVYNCARLICHQIEVKLPSQPLFSVVIPNWNGAKFLPTCLDALNRQTYPSIEIIIADNASQDGSQALIKRDYPQVQLVELPENRGFTGACNAGIRAAKG